MSSSEVVDTENSSFKNVLNLASTILEIIQLYIFNFSLLISSAYVYVDIQHQ